jgi:hypothetical protein
MVVVIVGILYKIFTSSDKIREDELVHSRELIKEVFEKNIEFGRINYNQDIISATYVNWAETSPFFPYALRHLENKKYKDSWQLYIDGQTCNELIIFDVIKKIQKYRELVKRKLESEFKELKTFEQSEYIWTNYKNQYFPRFINHLVFCDILNRLKTGKNYKEFRLRQMDSLWRCIEWGSSGSVATADNKSLDNLLNVLTMIENDGSIVDIITEIHSIVDINIVHNGLDMQLHKSIKLEQFDRWRKEIIRQVLYDKKPLKGECKGCPTSYRL